LEKRRGGVNTMVLLTESFTARFGICQKHDVGFASHSIYGHLDVKLTPEPRPVDELYRSPVDPFASTKLFVKGAREGESMLAPATHITNLQDVRKSIEAEICSVVESSSSAPDQWSAFCAQQARENLAKR